MRMRIGSSFFLEINDKHFRNAEILFYHSEKKPVWNEITLKKRLRHEKKCTKHISRALLYFYMFVAAWFINIIWNDHKHCPHTVNTQMKIQCSELLMGKYICYRFLIFFLYFFFFFFFKRFKNFFFLFKFFSDIFI